MIRRQNVLIQGQEKHVAIIKVLLRAFDIHVTDDSVGRQVDDLVLSLARAGIRFSSSGCRLY